MHPQRCSVGVDLVGGEVAVIDERFVDEAGDREQEGLVVLADLCDARGGTDLDVEQAGVLQEPMSAPTDALRTASRRMSKAGCGGSQVQAAASGSWIATMARPGMHEIERVLRKPGRRGVRVDELDRQAVLLGELPSRVDHPGLTVEPDDPSLGTDPVGEQVKDAENTAADVDGGVTWIHTDPVQELCCLLRVRFGLFDEVTDLGRAVPQQVAA